jgi:hypothetical protein
VIVTEQIKALVKVGCEDAIQEIRRNRNRPLSSDRLNHYIENAINTGLVSRVIALAEIRGMPLTPSQADRLTQRCLQLEWFLDALCAARLGTICDQTRRELTSALVSNQIADNQEEALQLLKESE